MRQLKLANLLNRTSFTSQVVILALVVFSSCRQGDTQPVIISNPLEIKVVGKDFYWHFFYPGPDQVLGTSDDVEVSKDLFVPAGHSVRLLVTSEDYIYFFRVSEFGLREVAIPDLIHEITFVSSSVGVSELEVDPMCSAWEIHKDGSMGNMNILSEKDFKSWLGRQMQSK